MSHSRTPVKNNLSLFCVFETEGHDSNTNFCGLWMFVTVSILSLRDSVSGSDVHTELAGGDSLLLPAEVLKALDKASSSLGEGGLRGKSNWEELTQEIRDATRPGTTPQEELERKTFLAKSGWTDGHRLRKSYYYESLCLK